MTVEGMNMRADTSSLAELVEKLRRGPIWSDGSPIGAAVGEVNGATMDEAADRLESYALLVERMREALNNAGAYLETRVGDWPERVLAQVREALGTQGG